MAQVCLVANLGNHQQTEPSSDWRCKWNGDWEKIRQILEHTKQMPKGPVGATTPTRVEEKAATTQKKLVPGRCQFEASQQKKTKFESFQ